MGRHLSTQQFDQVLQRLSVEYDIYAPKRFEKQGRFSDTDVIRYDTIETLDEIVWDEKSTFSPKDVVIPVTQTLFFFTEEEYREPKESDRKILVFLRPCDINGFRRLDTIYLRNGEDPDFFPTGLFRAERYESDHPGILALRAKGAPIPIDPGSGPATNQYVEAAEAVEEPSAAE